jgi:uncharacterized membrane protein
METGLARSLFQVQLAVMARIATAALGFFSQKLNDQAARSGGRGGAGISQLPSWTAGHHRTGSEKWMVCNNSLPCSVAFF